MLHFQELNCLARAHLDSRGDTVIAGGTPFMEENLLPGTLDFDSVCKVWLTGDEAE